MCARVTSADTCDCGLQDTLLRERHERHWYTQPRWAVRRLAVGGRMPDVDEGLLVEVLREMSIKQTHTLELSLRALSVLQLTGLIQLALRHPGISARAASRTTGERFLEGARAFFAECPAVLEVIQRGDDPNQDVPVVE
jgi:hypothetical protein